MTDDPRSLADLETALTRLIRRAFLPTAGEATRRAAGVQLERAAYAALVRIEELGDPRLSDLAAVLGLDASTTSRHVRGLVDAGYVTRAPDPADGRAHRLRPTRRGRTVLEKVRAARCAHLQRVLADWTEDDVSRLATGLERLVSDLDERA